MLKVFSSLTNFSGSPCTLLDFSVLLALLTFRVTCAIVIEDFIEHQSPVCGCSYVSQISKVDADPHVL